MKIWRLENPENLSIYFKSCIVSYYFCYERREERKKQRESFCHSINSKTVLII